MGCVKLSLNWLCESIGARQFDTVGITEAEEGSVPTSGIIRASTINGRTTTATLCYSF